MEKKFKIHENGFTLIELLVVMSIIFLLVVLNIITVNFYRDKARDTRVATSLGQIRSVAAIIYNENNGYSGANGVCNETDQTLNDAKYKDIKIIEDETKRFNDNQPVTCYAQQNLFCVSSPQSNGRYCVDSTGFAGEERICDSSVFCY